MRDCIIASTAWWLEQHDDSSESDEEIHKSFDHRPCTKEKIHDIQIRTDISSERDESPVQRADKNQNKRQIMETAESTRKIYHKK